MMQELSLNVLDVAENSVRAGATLVTIAVEEDPGQDRMTITIEDNGRGMTPEQAANVTDPFFTTRTTRRVGLGVPFFKMAAQLSGGDLTIRSTLGKGTRVEAVFGLSSIDRMPLGDISGTIESLIQCNPDIDFCYRRRVGDREFSADTREFRQILEDIPLNDPQVMSFIREYLRENTEELLSSREEKNT